MKAIKSHFSYHTVRKAAAESGKGFHAGQYLILMILFQAVLAGAGLLYRLQWWGLFLVGAAGFMCLPVLLTRFFLQKKEDIRFNEVDIYLHQMVYSFERVPKISLAWTDADKVLNGPMKKHVLQAEEMLACGDNATVYRDAAAVIEAAYDCPRMKTLHRFLIHIEEKGGRYHNSLEVLLSDFDRWVKRVYKYQQEICQVKRNALIGIFLSFGLAAVTTFIGAVLENTSGICLNIVEEGLYQVTSVLFILLNMLYFVSIHIHYQFNWLGNGRREQCVRKDYRTAFDTGPKAVRLFAAGLGVLGLGCAIMVGLFFQVWTGVLLAGISLYLAAVPALNRKKAFQRLQEDVYTAFSEWLRDVVINLQEEPLQAAIEDTYASCPVVIKPSLEQFILELEKEPADVRPYYHFLSAFQLLDISSTVKTLYAVSELASEEIDRTVNTFIRRNYEIMDKHEEIRNQNSISGMRFGEYIPMLFVSVKMAVDMLLIITNYL